MFRNPRGLGGEDGWKVVKGFCFTVPPLTSSLLYLHFDSFFLLKEHIEQGICNQSSEGAWTFVKRFDCTAHAEHNRQVIYRAW